MTLRAMSIFSARDLMSPLNEAIRKTSCDEKFDSNLLLYYKIVSSWKLDIDPVGWSGFKPAGDRSESCERWAPKFRFVVVLQVGIAVIALIIGSLLE